jgi:voltage-dependent calcium channel
MEGQSSTTTSEKGQQSQTFLTRMIHSSEGHKENILSLPFRLSVVQSKDKIDRNVPYLRQSWNRIDFVAIVSFWVTFMLAMNGWERGVKHIGIFRAMSVLRTARLLTITSGTTVSSSFHVMNQAFKAQAFPRLSCIP